PGARAARRAPDHAPSAAERSGPGAVLRSGQAVPGAGCHRPRGRRAAHAGPAADRAPGEPPAIRHHRDTPDRHYPGGRLAAAVPDRRLAVGLPLGRALDLIGAVRALADTNPEVELATSADQVRAAAARGHVAALMGVEGGHAIENSLEKLDSLYRLGVRYMTLTWNNGNDWAGSSADADRHGGLTPLGRRVVR